MRTGKNYQKWLRPLSFLILLTLSCTTVVAAIKMEDFAPALPFTTLAPFASGLVLSALNPLHFPFWAGRNVALQAKGALRAATASYSAYLLAIGCGTAAAFLLYGFGGGRLINLVHDIQYIVNWVIGITLLLTALLQIPALTSWRKVSVRS